MCKLEKDDEGGEEIEIQNVNFLKNSFFLFMKLTSMRGPYFWF